MATTKARGQSAPPDPAAAAVEECLAAEPALMARGLEWLESVAAHRRAVGAFGKSGVDVVRTPDGLELRLTEETTFRPAAGGACPLARAIRWVADQAARRAAHGSTGTFRLESSDQRGVVSFARVVEVTVVTAAGDGKSGPKSESET